ncbi:Amyloid-beta A4 precursor protein-binding family A member 2 [Camelus dromedarius]|uniref:Amyloid-beta A4 protein-binding family A member 2 n=1 Tax=Camelus dromedarius TaxID=9838 RepID=A0A5N4CEZ6_CAMDR|nr:Amyloid-beta A4 precursor protein-binding family A member 2 [Camelus dromedarius]
MVLDTWATNSKPLSSFSSSPACPPFSVAGVCVGPERESAGGGGCDVIGGGCDIIGTGVPAGPLPGVILGDGCARGGSDSGLHPGDAGRVEPAMANRTRESTASSMLDHRARPGRGPHGQEPESEDTELPLEEYAPPGLEPPALRPESPAPAEPGGHDHSPDGDSSSDYVNNTSEEEDYDEGLPEEEEGITYYIRYCPEDDSYLEGMDCNGEGYLAHGARHLETDECQEAVEEWKTGRPDPARTARTTGTAALPIPEDESSVLEAQDQEEGVHYCASEEGYPDYYPTEANGNAGGASPYRPRRGDGDLEDQEEDIDQIVAEIKMSLSMTSIASAGEASPEHAPARGPEPGPGDSAEAGPPGEASCGPSRHEGRPKCLNLPPEAKHSGDPQRSFKTKTRTPEERPKWPQEQVGSWLSSENEMEEPREQRPTCTKSAHRGRDVPVTASRPDGFFRLAGHQQGCGVAGQCREPQPMVEGCPVGRNRSSSQGQETLGSRSRLQDEMPLSLRGLRRAGLTPSGGNAQRVDKTSCFALLQPEASLSELRALGWRTGGLNEWVVELLSQDRGGLFFRDVALGRGAGCVASKVLASDMCKGCPGVPHLPPQWSLCQVWSMVQQHWRLRFNEMPHSGLRRDAVEDAQVQVTSSFVQETPRTRLPRHVFLVGVYYLQIMPVLRVRAAHLPVIVFGDREVCTGGRVGISESPKEMDSCCRKTGCDDGEERRSVAVQGPYAQEGCDVPFGEDSCVRCFVRALEPQALSPCTEKYRQSCTSSGPRHQGGDWWTRDLRSVKLEDPTGASLPALGMGWEDLVSQQCTFCEEGCSSMPQGRVYGVPTKYLLCAPASPFRDLLLWALEISQAAGFPCPLHAPKGQGHIGLQPHHTHECLALLHVQMPLLWLGLQPRLSWRGDAKGEGNLGLLWGGGIGTMSTPSGLTSPALGCRYQTPRGPERQREEHPEIIGIQVAAGVQGPSVCTNLAHREDGTGGRAHRQALRAGAGEGPCQQLTPQGLRGVQLASSFPQPCPHSPACPPGHPTWTSLCSWGGCPGGLLSSQYFPCGRSYLIPRTTWKTKSRLVPPWHPKPSLHLPELSDLASLGPFADQEAWTPLCCTSSWFQNIPDMLPAPTTALGTDDALMMTTMILSPWWGGSAHGLEQEDVPMIWSDVRGGTKPALGDRMVGMQLERGLMGWRGQLGWGQLPRCPPALSSASLPQVSHLPFRDFLRVSSTAFCSGVPDLGGQGGSHTSPRTTGFSVILGAVPVSLLHLEFLNITPTPSEPTPAQPPYQATPWAEGRLHSLPCSQCKLHLPCARPWGCRDQNDISLTPHLLGRGWVISRGTAPPTSPRQASWGWAPTEVMSREALGPGGGLWECMGALSMRRGAGSVTGEEGERGRAIKGTRSGRGTGNGRVLKGRMPGRPRARGQLAGSCCQAPEQLWWMTRAEAPVWEQNGVDGQRLRCRQGEAARCVWSWGWALAHLHLPSSGFCCTSISITCAGGLRHIQTKIFYAGLRGRIFRNIFCSGRKTTLLSTGFRDASCHTWCASRDGTAMGPRGQWWTPDPAKTCQPSQKRRMFGTGLTESHCPAPLVSTVIRWSRPASGSCPFKRHSLRLLGSCPPLATLPCFGCTQATLDEGLLLGIAACLGEFAHSPSSVCSRLCGSDTCRWPLILPLGPPTPTLTVPMFGAQLPLRAALSADWETSSPDLHSQSLWVFWLLTVMHTDADSPTRVSSEGVNPRPPHMQARSHSCSRAELTTPIWATGHWRVWSNSRVSARLWKVGHGEALGIPGATGHEAKRPLFTSEGHCHETAHTGLLTLKLAGDGSPSFPTSESECDIRSNVRQVSRKEWSPWSCRCHLGGSNLLLPLGRLVLHKLAVTFMQGSS